MCNYVYQNKGKNHDGKNCYYSDKTKKRYLDLPIDKKGFCLFHSEDKEFKKENSFDVAFQGLIRNTPNIYNGIEKYKWKYSFVGFIFTEDIHFNDLLSDVSIDLSNCQFFGDIKFNNLNIYSIDFNDCHFHKRLSLDSVKIAYNIYCLNSIFENGLNISNSTLESALYFEKCNFKNETQNVGFEIRLKGNEIHSISFESSIISNRVSVDTNTFKQEIIFDKCILYDEFLFENNVINGLVGIREAEFLLSENLNDFYSGVTFGDNILNETGKILFRGKKPIDDMIKSELAFFYKSPLKGLISFENFDLNKIYPENKIKLIELEKENPNIVYIDKSCSKYQCKTKIFEIVTSEENQNFILSLVNIFCNYFKIENSVKIGVEIIEQNNFLIRYYYYTDEKMSSSEFYDKIRKNEFEIRKTLNNLADVVKTALVYDNIDILDCLIELDSWWKKLGLRIIKDKMNTLDVLNVINSISIDQKTESQINLFIQQIGNQLNLTIKNNHLISTGMAQVNIQNGGKVDNFTIYEYHNQVINISKENQLDEPQTTKVFEIIEEVGKLPEAKKESRLKELCKEWFPTIAGSIAEAIKPFVM